MSAIGEFLFLTPAGLLALAALLIPLLIHLFSRSKGKRVLIGHVDLVKKARRQRVTEMRLTQWLLLALRLLIFTLAALILAQLARQGLGDRPGDVAYLTRGWMLAAGTEALDEVIDANPGGVFELAPGFAEVTTLPDPVTPLPAAQLHNAWPLLAERLSLEAHTGQVTVHSTGLAGELGSALPDLPGEVSWSVLDDVQAASPLPMLRVRVVHDPGRQADADLVGVALDGIARHRLPGLTWERSVVGADNSAPDVDNKMIWLSDSPAPATANRNMITLAEVPRSAEFPDALLHALLGDEGRRLSWANSQVPAERLERARLAETPGRLPNRPMQTWLAILLIALWAAERWLSERRQGP